MKIVSSLILALLGFQVGFAGLLESARTDSQGRARTRGKMEETSWKSHADSPTETAFSYLRAEGQSLGLTPDQSTFQVLGAEVIPGGSHVRMIQTHQGVPVLGSETVVSINARNEVVMVTSGARPITNLVNTTPSLNPIEAVAKAKDFLQIKGEVVDQTERAEIFISDLVAGSPMLVYRCSIISSEPLGDWEVLIDAHTGKLISFEDRFVQYQHVQGSGYVYLPDPISKARSQYGFSGFHDNNDAASSELNLHRTLVTLDSIRFENGRYALIGPYCSITDIEAPNTSEYWTAETSDGFQFDRNHQAFEAVNAYYHATSAYQHLLELGFVIPSLARLRIDPHGYYGEDNSHYSPTGNWISFGEGGVDDAEDACVIWHEYAHAIQYNINPIWGGGDTRALGEGFGDYWAASYARSFGSWNSGEEENDWLFMWDGHNPFWNGRILNDSRTYPFGNLTSHEAGQIWSAALMGIWGDLGKDITDRLVIKSQYYLGYGVTASDAARAILQADKDLYGGIHLSTLVYWLGTVKKFLDPADELPMISHTPATGVGTTQASFLVRAVVASSVPIADDAVQLCWSKDDGPVDTTAMIREGNSETFVAEIPATGKDGVYEYYIIATDQNGIRSVSPYAAPSALYTLETGNPAADNKPEDFELAQNYPNPFNPSTTISFDIPEDASVRLAVYNLLGEEIALLADGILSAGKHQTSWSGRNSHNQIVATGAYVYRLVAQSSLSGTLFVESRKMLFVR